MISYDLKKIYEWPFMVQLIVFIALAVLVFYLGFLLDISRIRKNITIAKQKQIELKHTFKASVEQRVGIEKTILQFPAMKNILESWKKQIATKAEIPGILDKLIKIGEEDKVKFNLFDPDDEKKDGAYYKVPVKIEVSGSYDDIANFISHAANMTKLVVIENFTILKEASSSSDKNSSTSSILNSDTKLTGQLLLEIYRL